MQLTATQSPFHLVTSPIGPLDLAQALNDYDDVDSLGIIQTALHYAERPVISTNFRPGSAALLHMVVSEHPNIPVIWVDTGFNTASTYRHVDRIARSWNLNLRVFTVAELGADGQLKNYFQQQRAPEPSDPAFEQFVEAVKLEPFRRAFKELEPDVWFTGIRREQTAYRRDLTTVSAGPNGALRIAPLLNWDSGQVDDYYVQHQIFESHDYVDPTKPQAHLECGLQLLAT